MIARKAEHLKAIEENNCVKKLYLEAYSKKSEYEVAKKDEDANATSEQPKEQVHEETTATQVKEEPKVEVPKIDVAAIQAEAEKKGLVRACSSLSKLFLLTNLFKDTHYTNQMEDVSGMAELSVLVSFKEELLKRETDNTATLANINAKFVDFVNAAPTPAIHTHSMDFVADLVERVVSNQHFADLTLKNPAPVSVPAIEKVEVVKQEEVVEKAPTVSRKESQKQREQHDMFMVEDDDEEEHNEDADNNDAEEHEQIVESKVEAVKQPLQEQNGNKQAEKEKPKNLNDDEDEWVEVNKGRTNHYDNRNKDGYRGRGNNRGGRGRGNNRNGERREWKDKEGNGERREWKDKDGNVIEKRERREWKDKDGNVIERKDRREYDGERKNNYTRDGERENNYRNGGRGRGNNRGGRGGRGGKRDGQLERKKENDVPQNEGQNLKQVGTKDSVEVNNAPVQEVAQE